MRNRAWVAIASLAAVLLVFGVTTPMAASLQETGSAVGTPGTTEGGGPTAGGSPGKIKGQMSGLSEGGPPPSGAGRVSATPSPFHVGQNGGEAVVVRVDQPDNCLRIRRGPSTAYEQIGCAAFGKKLRLTGVFSNDNRWAQLDNNGWVFAGQIMTNVKPPGGGGTAARSSRSRYSQSTEWEEPTDPFSDDVFSPSYWGTSYYFYPYWGGHHRWRHKRWHGRGDGGWRRGGGGWHHGGGWRRGGGRGMR